MDNVPLIIIGLYEANKKFNYVCPSIINTVRTYAFNFYNTVEQRRSFSVQTKAYANACDYLSLKRIVSAFVYCLSETEAYTILQSLVGYGSVDSNVELLRSIVFDAEE